jgi:hypothetical protein
MGVCVKECSSTTTWDIHTDHTNKTTTYIYHEGSLDLMVPITRVCVNEKETNDIFGISIKIYNTWGTYYLHPMSFLLYKGIWELQC